MFVVENCIEHRRKVYKKLSKGEICVANYISLVNVASRDSFFGGQITKQFFGPCYFKYRLNWFYNHLLFFHLTLDI